MESAPNIQPPLYPGSPALFHLLFWGGSIYSLLALIFTVWMIVDCVRNGREYYWIWLMLVFWGPG
ncbi:hypothetical protein HY256_11855, partial [Candidatus Sumerlaeota bacterium]|nr:hypothetical protein [Candidatus Sumerlaeota bacterium]